jgi:RHS repeat-associated protein
LNARSFSYDAYGNVLSNGVHSFQYNLAGNLMRTSDLNIDYRYDGHKRRVQEIDNSASQTTYSMYSQSGQLMHKLKGGVATDYIYAGSLLVAEKSGSTVDYMYTDLLGSPIAGNNGSAYKEHYRPWGEKKDHPLQLSDDVGYTGHQSDIETGLTYMQARYYDPVVGRFYAVDPVRFNGKNPGHFNLFTYVGNNPLSFIDPNGEERHSLQVTVKASFLKGGKITIGGAIDTESKEFSVSVGAGPRAGLSVGIDAIYSITESSQAGNSLTSSIIADATASLAGIGEGSAENGFNANTATGVTHAYPDEPKLTVAGVTNDGDIRLNGNLGADVGVTANVGVNVSVPDTLASVKNAITNLGNSVKSSATKARDFFVQ